MPDPRVPEGGLGRPAQVKRLRAARVEALSCGGCSALQGLAGVGPEGKANRAGQAAASRPWLGRALTPNILKGTEDWAKCAARPLVALDLLCRVRQEQLTLRSGRAIMNTEGDDRAMEKGASFAEVLEVADGLPLDDQESLAEILHRRFIERRRSELAREALEARQEYEQGQCRPVTVDALLSEILA